MNSVQTILNLVLDTPIMFLASMFLKPLLIRMINLK